MTELTAHQRAQRKQYQKRKETHCNIFVNKELRDKLKAEAHAKGYTIEGIYAKIVGK